MLIIKKHFKELMMEKMLPPTKLNFFSDPEKVLEDLEKIAQSTRRAALLCNRAAQGFHAVILNAQQVSVVQPKKLTVG